MKLRAHLICIALAALAGISIGYLLRAAKVQSKVVLNPATKAQTGTPSSPASIKLRRSGAAVSPLVAKLDRDLSMSSGVTRWICWMEAVEKAQPNDFPQLLRFAENNPAFLRLLATRWVELYPRHLLNTLADASRNGVTLPYQLSEMLFDIWPKRDPDALVAALDETQNAGALNRWRDSVARNIFSRDVEKGLSLMSRWHVENFIPDMDPVAKWAAADPVHAADFAIAHPAGSASEAVLRAIGREWAKSDPKGALVYAFEKGGDQGPKLAAAAFGEWSARDVANAADWLAHTDPTTLSQLSGPLVQNWAKQDLEGALTWAQSNLTGLQLTRGVGAALGGAAEKDIGGAAAFVASMQPSTARTEAAAAIARKWFPNSFGDKPIPPETIRWLSQLDPDSIKRAVSEVSWTWVESDPASLAAFLDETPVQGLPSHVYSALARNMTRKDPIGALDWTRRIPEGQRMAVGDQVFTDWREMQPDAAVQWLAKLPEADPRRQLFFEKAIQDWARDPNKSEQLATFAAVDRRAARGIVEKLPLAEDRKSQLLATLKPN